MELMDIFNNISAQDWETLKSATVILSGIVIALVIYFMNG